VKRTLFVVALLAVACSREDPRQKALGRLQKAEAAMTECKQRIGLGDIPTPDTVVLADPAIKGAELTVVTAGQLRLKVECRLELDELLDARREAAR
jgi:hypothetical protein